MPPGVRCIKPRNAITKSAEGLAENTLSPACTAKIQKEPKDSKVPGISNNGAGLGVVGKNRRVNKRPGTGFMFWIQVVNCGGSLRWNNQVSFLRERFNWSRLRLSGEVIRA